MYTTGKTETPMTFYCKTLISIMELPVKTIKKGNILVQSPFHFNEPICKTIEIKRNFMVTEGNRIVRIGNSIVMSCNRIVMVCKRGVKKGNNSVTIDQSIVRWGNNIVMPRNSIEERSNAVVNH
jgi:hypothetical protein